MAERPVFTQEAKQTSINKIALSIATPETTAEMIMRQLGKFMEACHEFRKEMDVHIYDMNGVYANVGKAMEAAGQVSHFLALAHRELDDVRAQHEIPPPGYGGPITPLNGGGKN